MTVFLLPSWDCDPHLLFLNSNESKGEKIWEERGHHWDQKKENIPWFYDFRIISWEWLRMMCCSENEESIGKDWKKEESKPLPKVSCRSCLKGPGWLNWAVYLSNAKKKKKKKKEKKERMGRKCGGKEWKTWDAFNHLQIIPRWIQPAWSDGIAISWIVRSSI